LKDGRKTTVRIFYKIVSDTDANSKFIVFYVPEGGDSVGIIKFLAAEYQGYFTDVETQHWAVMKSQGASDAVNTKDLAFSGRVFVYHEDTYSIEQQAEFVKLFRQHGATLLLRGPDHSLAVFQTIESGKITSPPSYVIRDGIPQLAH
jgi:hypothetical protein